MTQAEVLQLIGPPQPDWTAYFKARDELVWEWRYCDSWREAALDVLFDGTTKKRYTPRKPGRKVRNRTGGLAAEQPVELESRQPLVGERQPVGQHFQKALVEVHAAGFGSPFECFAAYRDDLRFGQRHNIGAT